jgi:hypothetical protein
MTEAEWLAATDPEPMQTFLRDKASDRKFRLFSSACVRFVWSLSCKPPPSVVSTVEEFADALTTKAALKKARLSMRQERHCLNEAMEGMNQKWLGYWLTEVAASENGFRQVLSELVRLSSELSGVIIPEPNAICDLYRDIFGNPFRPVSIESTWLTSTVVQLGEGIYQERAFDRFPILADCLQEAGCESDGILNHLRSRGPHVRGCWVLDLILGKA